MNDRNYLKKIINGLSEEKRNDVKTILKLAKVNPEVLDIALENTTNKELALNVMETDFSVINKVSDELKKDSDFMLKAMDIDKKAIDYAADDLKADKPFMLEAIKKDKNAYFEAALNLKEDDDILIAAVSRSDYTLDDTHEEEMHEEITPEYTIETQPLEEEVHEEVVEEPVQEEVVNEPVEEKVVEPTFEEMIKDTEVNPEITAFDNNEFTAYTAPQENTVSNENIYKNVEEQAPNAGFNPTVESQIEDYAPALDMLNDKIEKPVEETVAQDVPVLDPAQAIDPVFNQTQTVEAPGLDPNAAITFDSLNMLGQQPEDQALYNFQENQNYNTMPEEGQMLR